MGTHRFKIEGKDFEVQVGTRIGSRVNVTVNGKSYDVEVASQARAAMATPSAPTPTAVASAPPPAPAAATTSSVPGSGEVRAPISGVVLTVEVSPGDKVAPSTKVLVLEAMKMENDIFAAISGSVTQIHVKPQQEVREGDLLVSINPA